MVCVVPTCVTRRDNGCSKPNPWIETITSMNNGNPDINAAAQQIRAAQGGHFMSALALVYRQRANAADARLFRVPATNAFNAFNVHANNPLSLCRYHYHRKNIQPPPAPAAQPPAPPQPPRRREAPMTDYYALMCHGCIVDKFFVVPPGKTVSVLAPPGVKTRSPLVDAILKNKTDIRRVMKGGLRPYDTNHKMYIRVFKAGDVMVDMQLTFGHDHKARGLARLPLPANYYHNYNDPDFRRHLNDRNLFVHTFSETQPYMLSDILPTLPDGKIVVTGCRGVCRNIDRPQDLVRRVTNHERRAHQNALPNANSLQTLTETGAQSARGVSVDERSHLRVARLSGIAERQEVLRHGPNGLPRRDPVHRPRVRHTS